MKEQTDKPLFRNFGLIVVLLALLAFFVVLIAKFIVTAQDSVTPESMALADQRTKPVAKVYTSQAEIPVVTATATGAAPEQPVVTSDGPDGEEVYTNACAACHASGLAGAPRPGSDDMALRAEKGMDALLQTALNGLNAMPARGGRPDLSDEEIKAAIDFMLE